MKRTGYITMICLTFICIVNGQNSSTTKSDFYGNWTLDLNDYKLEDDDYIFRKHKEFKNSKEEINITITLLDSDECRINYDSASSGYCGFSGSRDYSWTINKDLGIINIYHSKKWLKAFKEENPEEYKNLDLPNKYDEMELSLIALENGSIGLKIINWE
ncbi:hypothetical protein [Maribacter sp.]|uniref:hypothetical protein n=1 Tax=Maribacter sp. TaxID=1897614 RepID=UPI003297A190